MAIGKLAEMSYVFYEEPVEMCFEMNEDVIDIEFKISCKCTATSICCEEFQIDKKELSIKDFSVSINGETIEKEDELQSIVEFKINFSDSFFISNFDCYFDYNLVSDELRESELFKDFIEKLNKTRRENGKEN